MYAFVVIISTISTDELLIVNSGIFEEIEDLSVKNVLHEKVMKLLIKSLALPKSYYFKGFRDGYLTSMINTIILLLIYH